MLQGTLFKYGSRSAQVAFKFGKHKTHAIMIGGLTDGFFACSYVEPLSRELDAQGVSLVQTLLSSSHQGYGTASLDQDAAELRDLVTFLREDATMGGEGYALIGHSTGTQDCVRFVRNAARGDFVDDSSGDAMALPFAVVLQAAVSDRESLDMSPATWKNLQLAKSMIAEGKGAQLMPIETQEDGAPITANR